MPKQRSWCVSQAKSGRLLSVYQNRRWDGDFVTIQRLFAEGKFGRVVLFESHFDRFRPHLKANAWRERPEPGSGLLFDLGPHLIDQAMVLFGEPEAVNADVRIERDGASVDDAFDVMLRYPKLRALLRGGVLITTPTPRFVIHGTLGGYLKYCLDPQEDALKARGGALRRRLGPRGSGALGNAGGGAGRLAGGRKAAYRCG